MLALSFNESASMPLPEQACAPQCSPFAEPDPSQQPEVADAWRRLLFREQLRQALHRADRDRAMLAVLAIGVTLREPARLAPDADLASRLQHEISLRLSGVLRIEDFAAPSLAPGVLPDGSLPDCGRFSVLLPRIGEPQDAMRVAVRIADQLALPLSIDGQSLQPRIDAGIAVFPWDHQQAEALIGCAEDALDSASAQAGDSGSLPGPDEARLLFHSKPMHALASDRLGLEASLRKALADGAFRLHFQPRVDARTREVLSVEALLRWRQPEQGLTPPSSFLEVAEQARLIVPIGAWAIREACRQSLAWQRAGLPALPVAVNLSPVQLRSPGFVASVADLLAETRLPAALLEFDITEAAICGDVAESLRLLRSLKEIGVRLFLDGYGAGVSSLACLKEFPLDGLRIDRSFIADLSRNGRAAAMTRAIIDLGAHLGLSVSATDVERDEQRQFLLTHGCRVMQGFLFARPVSAAAMEGFWRQSLARHGQGLQDLPDARLLAGDMPRGADWGRLH